MVTAPRERTKLKVKYGDEEGEIIIDSYKGLGTVQIRYKGKLPCHIIRDFQIMAESQQGSDFLVSYASGDADL